MNQRNALAFVVATVALDAIGIGLIFPVMPDLVEEVAGTDLSNAAVWGGVLATAYALMQFVFGPVVGNISDRWGRRPVLLSALAVMTLDYLLMAVAGTIWLLLLGRIVAGLTAATHATATAFIADITPPEQRAARFGMVGAAFGIGFVAGPLIGGLLAAIDLRAPFWAAAALAAANLVFGALVLPETVTDEIRRPFSWARANPLSSFRAIGHLPGLRRILLMMFVYSIAFNVYPVVWSYYGKARFGWDAWMIGVSLAAFGICMALVQALAVGPTIRLLGERRTVLWGMTSEALTFLFYGFVTAGWLALAFSPFAALGGVVGPALQGIMSKATPDDQQGELQGVLSSIGAMATIIAPLLMTGTFRAFTGPEAPVFSPGAPFLLAAGLTVICLILLLDGRRTVKAGETGGR
ncbi:MAG: TCR/Tet family MFS transporter [Paracoccaceae bacterium]